MITRISADFLINKFREFICIRSNIYIYIAFPWVISIACCLIFPGPYIATASIEMAKVNNIKIENSSIIIDRVKVPNYFNSNLYTACGIKGKNFEGSIKFASNSESNILKIDYISNNKDIAISCVGLIAEQIIYSQNLNYESILNSRMAAINEAKNRYEVLKKINSYANNRIATSSVSEIASPNDWLLLALLVKSNELKDLSHTINVLEEQISPGQSSGAKLVAEISVYKQNIIFKRIVYCTILIPLLGFVLWNLFIFFRGGRDEF